jgi:hypothetical protein
MIHDLLKISGGKIFHSSFFFLEQVVELCIVILRRNFPFIIVITYDTKYMFDLLRISGTKQCIVYYYIFSSLKLDNALYYGTTKLQAVFATLHHQQVKK